MHALGAYSFASVYRNELLLFSYVFVRDSEALLNF